MGAKLLKNRRGNSSENIFKIISETVVWFGIILVLLLLLYYRENYIFTIHDYLDSWPPLFEVLRRSGLFYSPDESMPIMQGLSTCYLYFDFGLYRLLNFVFGPIWGEIVNKGIGLIAGFYFARRLFRIAVSCFEYSQTETNFNFDGNGEQEYRNEWLPILLAGGYALTAVYPNWTITFAFLPLYIEIFFKIATGKDRVSLPYIIASLMFGFLIYFPAVGMFVYGLFFLIFLVDSLKGRKIKKNFVLYGVLMFLSIFITNINVFIYMLRGDSLNRSLFSTTQPMSIAEGVFRFIKQFAKVGLIGQYHAAPVLYILIPLCVVGYVILLFQLSKKKEIKRIIIPTVIASIIIFLCLIYALNEVGILGYVVSKILPFLKGFNLGRVVYFNNLLWFILFISIFIKIDRSKLMNMIVFALLIINIGVVIIDSGYYRDTVTNIFHERSLNSGSVTFKQFYDTEYFTSLKDDIKYSDEGVISVGYHPAVAMFNGFNTIDGYMCINPLNYHYKFREIIKPTLDMYPDIASYYDTWGGRLYCYVDESMDVSPEEVNKEEAKELLINPDAFYDMGGRYILSKYELSNANNLGLALVEHKIDFDNSIYKVWVYRVERND